MHELLVIHRRSTICSPSQLIKEGRRKELIDVDGDPERVAISILDETRRETLEKGEERDNQMYTDSVFATFRSRFATAQINTTVIRRLSR